ncbi:MAG: PEGA domain-containing protein [Archangium sp.]
MMTRLLVVLVAVGLSATAFAQDDDDLTPLGPIKEKPKAKPKAKPKPKPNPKPPVTNNKPPPGGDDDLVPIAPIAAKGEMVVKMAVNMTGAVLLVDGKEQGTLPLPPLSIPSGEHTITVKRPGFAAFVKKVLVSGGKTIEVEAKLAAVSAVLSVESDQPGAQVLLNGKPIGVAPLNDVEVPPGPAEVAVIKDGYKEEAQKINFQAGKDYPVVVRFTPVAVASDRPVATNLTPGIGAGPVTGVSGAPEPITSKWYFWVGVAAAVIAVAVATSVGVAVGTQKKPLDEHEICGADGCDGCIGIMCGAGIRF